MRSQFEVEKYFVRTVLENKKVKTRFLPLSFDYSMDQRDFNWWYSCKF